MTENYVRKRASITASHLFAELGVLNTPAAQDVLYEITEMEMEIERHHKDFLAIRSIVG